MGDFLLDFRGAAARQRSVSRGAPLLKFCEDTQTRTVDRKSFSLLLSRVDGFDLWGPCETSSAKGKVLVALAGRIALDEREWDSAKKVSATGGLACKAILQRYEQGGVQALGKLNGNFVVFVHDEAQHRFHLVTDRCGMFLAYGNGPVERSLVFGSHPDVLASVCDESENWDRSSLAEFLMTSQVSFPHTYYRNIRALEPGCVFSFDLKQGNASFQSATRCFPFDFRIDEKVTEEDLAAELGAAFTNAVRRRTLPLFGRTAVGLSGGLDSRTVLSAVDRRIEPLAFTLFDKENTEYNAAKAIAEACGVELLPIRRDFDYYGDSAEAGVRISGGTGCVSCNHFLGIRGRLRQADITNLLTGCYCDYLFKALPINRRERWLSRSEEVNGFQFEFYDSFHWLKTPFRQEVLGRLESRFPESAKSNLSEGDWLEVERKRTFPFAYEQDLAQRVIPQRVFPWYVPMVDNDIIDAYLKIPPRFKLNAGIFRKMVRSVCPPAVCAVPDSNTSARLDSGWPQYALHRCWSSLRNRVEEKMRPQLATAGSWPNWRHYFKHSTRVESLWQRPNETAREIFSTILGEDPQAASLHEYADRDVPLLQRLFTLKLWLDQRATATPLSKISL